MIDQIKIVKLLMQIRCHLVNHGDFLCVNWCTSTIIAKLIVWHIFRCCCCCWMRVPFAVSPLIDNAHIRLNSSFDNLWIDFSHSDINGQSIINWKWINHFQRFTKHCFCVGISPCNDFVNKCFDQSCEIYWIFRKWNLNFPEKRV